MPDSDPPPFESVRITDPQKLKVFTHPLRLRIYRALFNDHPTTASRLAAELDQQVSLVSYHLRKIAAGGFIEEAPERRADGRERWWRPTAQAGWEFREADFTGDPASAAIADEVVNQLLTERVTAYRRYLAQRAAWPTEWTNAAFTAQFPVRLTAAELAELNEELTELLTRWHQRGEQARAAGDTAGRERVEVQLYGFPEAK